MVQRANAVRHEISVIKFFNAIHGPKPVQYQTNPHEQEIPLKNQHDQYGQVYNYKFSIQISERTIQPSRKHLLRVHQLHPVHSRCQYHRTLDDDRAVDHCFSDRSNKRDLLGHQTENGG